MSPRAGQRLTFFGLTSRESTDAQFDGDNDDETLKLLSDTNNDLASVSYALPIGRRTSSTTTVSWYRNAEFLDFDGDFRTESRRSNRPDEDGQPLSNVLFTRTAAVRDIAVRQEFVIRAASTHLLETGFEHHALFTEWGWQIPGDRNADEPNGSSALGGAGLPSSLDSRRSSRRAGAWLTDSSRNVTLTAFSCGHPTMATRETSTPGACRRSCAWTSAPRSGHGGRTTAGCCTPK